MATPSSILAWETSRTGEPGGLQFVGHKESDATARVRAKCPYGQPPARPPASSAPCSPAAARLPPLPVSLRLSRPWLGRVRAARPHDFSKIPTNSQMLFSSLRNAFPHMVFSQSPEQHSYKVSPSLKILKREQFLIPPFWLSVQHTQRVWGL